MLREFSLAARYAAKRCCRYELRHCCIFSQIQSIAVQQCEFSRTVGDIADSCCKQCATMLHSFAYHFLSERCLELCGISNREEFASFPCPRALAPKHPRAWPQTRTAWTYTRKEFLRARMSGYHFRKCGLRWKFSVWRWTLVVWRWTLVICDECRTLTERKLLTAAEVSFSSFRARLTTSYCFDKHTSSTPYLETILQFVFRPRPYAYLVFLFPKIGYPEKRPSLAPICSFILVEAVFAFSIFLLHVFACLRIYQEPLACLYRRYHRATLVVTKFAHRSEWCPDIKERSCLS